MIKSATRICTHIDADGVSCPKPRTTSATLCPMHEARWRRHGSPNKTARGSGIGAPRVKPAWYEITYAPTHPLAGKSGQVYVHRAVLFGAIGAGEHPCHWCGKTLRWDAGRWHPDLLQADHVNHDPTDNRAENLVPSCRRCNTARGQQRRHREFVGAGFWSARDTRARVRRPPILEVDDAAEDASGGEATEQSHLYGYPEGQPPRFADRHPGPTRVGDGRLEVVEASGGVSLRLRDDRRPSAGRVGEEDRGDVGGDRQPAGGGAGDEA